MSGRVFYYSAAGGVSRRRLPGGLASPEPLGSESLGALLKAPRKLPRPPPPARRGLGAKIHREENETGCPPPAPRAKMAAPDPRASSSGRGCHGAAPPPSSPRPSLPPLPPVCVYIGQEEPEPERRGRRGRSRRRRPPALHPRRAVLRERRHEGDAGGCHRGWGFLLAGGRLGRGRRLPVTVRGRGVGAGPV